MPIGAELEGGGVSFRVWAPIARTADVLLEAGPGSPSRHRLERETAETFRRRGLALSLDVSEIDGTASLKTNNLHERLKARAKP